MSWLMRTAIKAKAGSQGTLFGMDKTQLSNAARWHRGYTPERLNQVRPHMVVAPWVQQGTGLEHRNLISTVARSTVPESHLLGIQWAPGQPSSAMHTNENENIGQYDYQGRALVGGEPPLISIKAGHATDSTAIHEIGHHVSYLQQGPVPYTTAVQRGREEGLADNYAQEHFRDRRGRPMSVPNYAGGLRAANAVTDENWHGAPGAQDYYRDRNQSFYDSYHSVRGTDPDPTGTAIDAEIKHKYDNPTLPGLERYHIPSALSGWSPK